MLTSLRQALLASLDLLLPPACLLCGALVPQRTGDRSFCKKCLTTMQPLSPGYCTRCAQPFHGSPSNNFCNNCLKRPPLFSAVHVIGPYKGSIKEAVQKLKYRNQVLLAKPLGQRLCQIMTNAENVFSPDLIIPVPLHSTRLKERGYNQALEIARPIAHMLESEIDTKRLRRVRRTPPQQGLSESERRSNLRNAFDVTAKVSKQKILLVDDVMTTGETVRECCRILHKGGAQEVQVAVVGRA